MNGVLLIDKPVGLSSQQVLSKIKRILNVKKIGHAGTLDPVATGVLVVLINDATKLSDYLLENNIDVFDFFNSDMYIPVENSGKNTHTYIDNEYLCFITDYKGKTKKVLCKSGVHLSPCDFTLNLGLEYAQFLIEMKNIINMK